MVARPHVLVCANSEVRQTVFVGEGRDRLDRLATWEWLPSEGVCADPELWGGPSSDPGPGRMPTGSEESSAASTCY